MKWRENHNQQKNEFPIISIIDKNLGGTIMSSSIIKNLSLGNKIIVISSIVAIIFYFFPWLATVTPGGITLQMESGLEIALPGINKELGISMFNLSLQVVFATLIAAIFCLILCLTYLIKGRSTKKIVPITQFILSLIGLLPFIILMFEVRNWTGVTVVSSYFFWITILAMIGILIGSILSYIEINRYSVQR
jgi:hypothetical protein